MKAQGQQMAVRESREEAQGESAGVAPWQNTAGSLPYLASSRSRRGDLQLALIALLLLCLTGCVSKPKARLDAQSAHLEGQQKILAEQAALQPTVWFRGDIRNPRVAWTEGLTLSRALLAAHYTWNSNPRLISITRNGEVYQVSAKLLLLGEDDPLLEPGDVIEVRH